MMKPDKPQEGTFELVNRREMHPSIQDPHLRGKGRFDCSIGVFNGFYE